MNERLREWRAKASATEEIELSLGTATIRARLSLSDLAAAGHIPATLLVELDEFNSKRGDARKATQGLAVLIQAINATTIAAMIDPPVAKVADDEHLGIDEIPVDDRLAVFYRLNQGVEPLRDFRSEQAGSNGVAHPGDDLPLPAVGDTGD